MATVASSLGEPRAVYRSSRSLRLGSLPSIASGECLARPEGHGPQGTSRYRATPGSVAVRQRGGGEGVGMNHLGFGQGL